MMSHAALTRPNVMTRRLFVAGLVTSPLIAGACGNDTADQPTSMADEFTLRHDGADVRCLFHDRLVSGERSGCLVIVLLHGAAADASQWFDIGLIEAVDRLELTLAVHRVVAVAPDIADDAAAGLRAAMSPRRRSGPSSPRSTLATR